MSPPQAEEHRSRPDASRRRSQSISGRQSTDSFIETLGHPATFRESFSIAADEMRKARSPSPPPRGHAHNFSAPVVSIAEEPEIGRGQSPKSDNTLTPRIDEPQDESDEAAPLIHREGDDHGHSRRGKSPEGAHSHGHSHGSMNMKAILLHVLGDALGNVGVIATGLIIWQTTWSFKYYFDPIISLVITMIIFSSAMPLGKSRSHGIPCQFIDRSFSLSGFNLPIADTPPHGITPFPHASPKHGIHPPSRCSPHHRARRSP